MAVIAPVIMTLAICALASTTAQADSAAQEHTTVRSLGAGLRLKFTDLSQGAFRACQLSDANQEVMFIAGLDNVLINGRSVQLDNAIQWNGSNFLISRKDAELTASRLQKRLHVEFQKPAKTPPKKSADRKPRIIVIDPGHGGKDPGAVRANLQEKTVNLDIALRLKQLLEAKGHQVVMTRASDVFLSLEARVNKSNQAKPDIFISIHANAEAALWGSAQGGSTFYPPKERKSRKPAIDERAKREAVNNSISPVHFGARGNITQATMITATKIAFESYRWMSISAAKKIQKRLAPVAGTSGANNGVKEDSRGLRVLSRIHAPAVLVEVDFMSNRARKAKLATDAYRAALANAIAVGVIDFFNERAR